MRTLIGKYLPLLLSLLIVQGGQLQAAPLTSFEVTQDLTEIISLCRAGCHSVPDMAMPIGLSRNRQKILMARYRASYKRITVAQAIMLEKLQALHLKLQTPENESLPEAKLVAVLDAYAVRACNAPRRRSNILWKVFRNQLAKVPRISNFGGMIERIRPDLYTKIVLKKVR